MACSFKGIYVPLQLFTVCPAWEQWRNPGPNQHLNPVFSTDYALLFSDSATNIPLTVLFSTVRAAHCGSTGFKDWFCPGQISSRAHCKTCENTTKEAIRCRITGQTKMVCIRIKLIIESSGLNNKINYSSLPSNTAPSLAGWHNLSWLSVSVSFTFSECIYKVVNSMRTVSFIVLRSQITT